MRESFCCLCLLASLFFAPPTLARSQSPEAVWVWPAAYAQKRDRFPGEVFVLQGHFPQNKQRVDERGPSPWPWRVEKLHLVLRLARVPRVEEVQRFFLARAARWEAMGVKVAGIQLDYDSPTARVGDYARTLRELRSRLPVRYALSATGLADWLQPQAPPLQALSGVEILFQMYQERRPHQNLRPYLTRLAAWRAPFRLGLLPKQTLSQKEQALLQQNPFFHGIVRFHGG